MLDGETYQAIATDYGVSRQRIAAIVAMTGTPIRSIVFIEAEALMRLVHESVAMRREFRLADVDKLLCGNKIVE